MLRRIRDLFSDVARQADLVLLALCSATSLFGILMIYSATRYMHTSRLVLVQAASLVIGVVLYLLMSQIDLNELVKYWKWIFLQGFGFVLLLATPLGIEGGTGNRAWLEFPFLPVKVQPAEIVKVTFIIVLAKQLAWLKEHRDLKSVGSMVMLALHFGVLFLTYYKISADMGSALVFLFIFACMCFVAGVALWWFIILFDHNYDPLDTGWQQTRSLLALGGGKIFGQGYLRGVQSQSELAASLPNRHTDFIFSVIGEELGMVGCVLTLTLLTAIVVRCVYVARRAKTRLEGYVCIGVASVIIFQVIVNVGMCLFVMPVIGLTLPFISYGGSSIVMTFALMGLVSGVHGRAEPDWLRLGNGASSEAPPLFGCIPAAPML